MKGYFRIISKWALIIILLTFFGISFKIEVNNLLGRIHKDIEKNMEKTDDKFFLAEQYIILISEDGNRYYKENLNSNGLSDKRYISKQNLYISENEESLVIGGKKSFLEKNSQRELRMSHFLSHNFKEISAMLPEIVWIYYLSSSDFINIYPEITSDKYSFYKKFYELNFYKEIFSGKNEDNRVTWSPAYEDPMGNGVVITGAVPVYEKKKLKGVVSLSFNNNIFDYLSENSLIKDVIVLDEENSIVFRKNSEGEEKKVSKFLDIVSEKMYEERYKFSYLKEGTAEKIGGNIVYFERLKLIPWKVYFVLKPLNIYIASLKNLAFVALGFILLCFMIFETSRVRKFKREKEESLKRLSSVMTTHKNEVQKDFLTGICNRSSFLKMAQAEYNRMKRYATLTSMVICDIDFFKRFNDTYGHDCGDYVLKEVTKLLKSNLRVNDTLCRWGGEEFLIILPETDYKGALFAAEKLRTSLERKEFFYEKNKLQITMTFGVALLTLRKGVEVSIKEADKALYSGKSKGRNCVVGYEEIKEKDER